MEEPVVSRYGHLYERRSIEEWIKRKGSCPFTYRRLQNEDIYPVYSLKIDIEEFRRRKEQWDE